MFTFIRGVVEGIKEVVVKTVKNIIENIEAVTLLSFSAIGVTAVLSELPFTVAMPLFIESLLVTPMILPLLSITIITALVMIMQYRLGE